MSSKGPELLTRAALGPRLHVHRQTITKWEALGCPTARRGRRGKPSLYDEAAVRTWLVLRKEAARRAAAPLDLAQERARLARSQAALIEQTRAVRARKLLPYEEVERVWAAEVSAARNHLLAWATMIADRVHRAAVLEGLPGVSRELDRAVREALTQLATAHPTLRPTPIKVPRRNVPAAGRKRKRVRTSARKRTEDA